MRLSNLFALVALVAGALSAVAAPITYNLNLTVGAGTATGFVKTDGTIGSLNTINVTDWSVLLNDGVSTATLLGPASGNNSQFIIANGGLVATATTLTIDLNSNWRMQNPCLGCGGSYLYINWSGNVADIMIRTNGTELHTTPSPASFVVAQTAAETGNVPEPTTLALTAAGVAVALVAQRRRKA